jgi:hypothetical protein
MQARAFSAERLLFSTPAANKNSQSQSKQAVADYGPCNGCFNYICVAGIEYEDGQDQLCAVCERYVKQSADDRSGMFGYLFGSAPNPFGKRDYRGSRAGKNDGGWRMKVSK